MQVVWLDLPSILWRRQRDFSITGSEREAEEAWLGSGAAAPCSSQGQDETGKVSRLLGWPVPPLSPSHSRLQGSSCLPFYFVLFFFRILAAFLRYNEKSIQCLVLIVI